MSARPLFSQMFIISSFSIHQKMSVDALKYKKAIICEHKFDLLMKRRHHPGTRKYYFLKLELCFLQFLVHRCQHNDAILTHIMIKNN